MIHERSTRRKDVESRRTLNEAEGEEDPHAQAKGEAQGRAEAEAEAKGEAEDSEQGRVPQAHGRGEGASEATPRAFLMAWRVFPVSRESSPKPSFSDDWGFPRSGGRTHKGNDIFAPAGTPVLAVDSGQVFFGTSSLGGNTARLMADDGDTFIYTHLDAFEGDERRVGAGDVIGYVGNTGNAAGTPPHVHFQYHPEGGEPVNPFPFLRAMLEPRPAPAPASPPLPRAAGRAARAAAAAGSSSGSLRWLACSSGVVTGEAAL